ncbi:hypothetical protein HN51_032646 [Arachis hypogaea]|uniref:C3H1-type domain-containing protein n=1 Tax=Arachis hypogaea TaxID=3818 RepID=A0A445B3Q4_ARAHY|nr:uncharacterized protein LOC112716268 [Arachis hypogaea]QHO16998.1 Zinc finger CCCH domain-containing protein [Arachis hypogaea]RYR33312.1 hypothetical protein Ahy_A10g047885 isoform A [Arachis hypogaea]RYR33313.1 hypothetical protein Ahy_A10g047885 isoform B [Arachis hypogaea]
MYHQVSHGPSLGQGGSHPPPPPPPNAYQQQQPPHHHHNRNPPPPPPQFQQGGPIPVPQGHHMYLHGHGPPNAPSTSSVNLPFQAPPGMVQSAGQYGNGMAAQTFTSVGQNLGAQSHHIPPSPPPVPPSRALPPPPPLPASSQGEILCKPPFGLPPPPPAGYVGNYQVPPVAPPLPPLPSSPPPILPPAPPMTSTSGEVSGTELKAVDSVEKGVASYPSGIAPICNYDPNGESGSCREFAASADRNELLSNKSGNLDPPPPPPSEEKTVQKIEALCQLIAENGPDIEDKIRQEEFQNPEYQFLFGGDRTEAAISHTYFLWMKKKYNLEDRWHEKKAEPQLRPLSVDSPGPLHHLHVATENADSDMEMEDDITLSDKDQGPNYAIEALTQQPHQVGEECKMNENTHQLQNSTENDPSNDILASGSSTCGSMGISNQHEGPGNISNFEQMKSAISVTKVHSPVNGSSEVAKVPLGTGFEKSAAPLAEGFIRNGTSDLVEAIDADRDSGQLIRSGSPIKLLQDYASDDTSGNEDEISAGAASGVSIAHKDSRSRLETDIGSKTPSGTQKGFGQLSETTLDNLVQKSKELIEDYHENQVSVAASYETIAVKDKLGSKSNNAEPEDERKSSKFEKNILKVDKFGRHPKEAPTDSDSESDDSHYRQTKRGSKRGRGRSRSRSPEHRSRSRSRRRRKSPRRRRDRRSRSRSRSPRYRRSRSRSPILRRTGDFGGENVKRDRGQCFGFVRGKCHRGASCRFSHHESDKNVSLRRHRNKYDQEVHSQAKHVSDGIRSQGVDQKQERNEKENSVRHANLPNTSGIDSQSVRNDPIKSESFRESVLEMKESLVGFLPEVLSGDDASKPCDGTNEDGVHAEDNSFVHKIQPNVPVGITGHPSYSSSTQTLPYMLPPTQPLSAPSSVGPSPSSRRPLLHSISSVELPPHAYQLPPPPVVSHAQGENAVILPQISRDYGVTQQNALFPFQPTTSDKFEPSPALIHMQSPHFSVPLPPNYPWTSLPLPPPPPLPSQIVHNPSIGSGVSTSYVSSEFNQTQLHSRGDFVSLTSGKPGLASHSQSSEFQDHAYPANQLLSGPNVSGEDHYKQLPMQDSNLSSSGGSHPLQNQYSWQSDAIRIQPSVGGNLPPEDHFKTSSHTLASSQQQQPVHSFQYSASEGNLGVPGETVTLSRYPPDVLDSNHSTSLPTFVGSRIPAHCNPYASTFEQPLTSKLSSTIFRSESDVIHGDNNSGLNPTSINREGAVGVEPKSSRANQYDPLFDSIEPPLSSLKKFDFEKQEVTGESNVSLRPKSSNMPLDAEEQNKHEEVGAVASTTSQNNDEYGETADAEVDDVENESLSNHVDVANMTPGEVEINQTKSPGKRKKSKDSRSMKLFKVSIANFVKEVLKPSWRQGNMSKVAFKTIVKKTVDKVSGAMKGHRMPKSQAKISQYIDSSQRKLTKLVMGYVDKYVKS